MANMIYDIELIIEDLYVGVRAGGPTSMEGNVDLCKRVIQACEDSGRKLVLADVRNITEPSGIIDLYQLAKEMTPLVLGKIDKCALIQRELGDMENFTEKTIRNQGMNIRSFHDEEGALLWLLNVEL